MELSAAAGYTTRLLDTAANVQQHLAGLSNNSLPLLCPTNPLTATPCPPHSLCPLAVVVEIRHP